MSERRRNFLVGLFMIAGLGALGFLMVMFGEAPSWLGGAEWDLKITVSEIAGIDDGTPIYLNGIKIGRVTTLDFVKPSEPERGVEIVGKIKNQFSIPRGARAECIAPAMGLGRGRIEIYAEGAGMPPIEPGGRIFGKAKNPLEDIIPESLISSFEGTVTKIGNFAETLTPVAGDLHQILRKAPVAEVDAGQVSANLYTAVERFDRILKNADQIIGDPNVRDGLLESIENIRMMSADGKAAFADFRDTSANLKADTSRVLDKVEGAVDTVQAKVTELADAAMPVLDNSARTAANLNLISRNLVDGKGTIGRLLQDEEMYEVVVLTVQRIQDFIDTLRRMADRFEKKGRIPIDYRGLPVNKEIPE